MSSLEAALVRVAGDLEALGRSWALVGALAVAARAESRATLDIDVAVASAGPQESAAVVSALRRAGYRWEHDFAGAMTSLSVPQGPPAGLRLDLLFSLTGIESEVARAAQRLEILPGLELPVASTGHLIALKLLAAAAPGREHDARDLRALAAVASADDLQAARAAIRLLENRGSTLPGRLGPALDRVVEQLQR